MEAQEIAATAELLRLVDATEHVVEVRTQPDRRRVTIDADDARLHDADGDRIAAQRHRVVGAVLADGGRGTGASGPAHQNR
jgi:hypothetical protein